MTRRLSVFVLAALLLAGCSLLNVEPKVGTPSNDPVPTDIRADLVAEINTQRAAGYTCISGYLAPSQALTWNNSLELAARRHAEDMVLNGADTANAHLGSDGSLVEQRAMDAGYGYIRVAENIIIGIDEQTDPATDVLSNIEGKGWLQSSSGHCEEVMNPDSLEVGVYVDAGHWVAVFGRPAAP